MASSSSSKSNSAIWKGKSKATENDYDDLSPVITYRHLHSHNLGVKDPLRVIALCDSDAFYAACEQVRLGIDTTRPLVVLQWESLIAVNYPARKFGISRMDKVKDALKRCPELVVVHVATFKEGEAEPGYWENPDTLTHKVSLDYYRRESWKIYHMFKEGLPTGEVEKASIDEAFIDFTRPVREEILKRYPYLAEVPPDAVQGKDSPLPPPPPLSWDSLSTVIPVHPPPSDDAKEPGTGSEDNCQSITPEIPKNRKDTQEPDYPTTWHDVALSIGAELMSKIRQDIHTKLGYTTSAGIARNKFLAKLTASYRKPNNQTVLRNAAIPNYLQPLPFQKIRFLGGKLGVALAQEYDVSTVSDLLTVNLDEMQNKFGEESIWVWEILRGIDRTEVKEKPPITKSMLASKNLPHPIVKASQGHHWIRVLAAELALRLKEAREAIPALWPKSIVLHVRQGYDGFRSKQAPFQFTKDISVDIIAGAGDKLWKELVGTESSRATPMKITNVSLSFSGMESVGSGQKRIEGFLNFSTKPPSTTGEASINSNVILKRKRTSSLDTDMREINDVPVNVGKEDDNFMLQALPTVMATTGTAKEKMVSFLCERCKKRIGLSKDFTATLGIGSDRNESDLDDEIKEALSKLRGEHDDFHFAQDLAANLEAGNGRATIRPAEIGPANKKSKTKKGTATRIDSKDKQKGIAKFFTQQ